jgi:transposase
LGRHDDIFNVVEHLVERFFNKIKQCRRIATRYDKLTASYIAFIRLASIRLWQRAYQSTP